MRRVFVATIMLVLLLSHAGCEGGGGAASVRWRIVDLRSGGIYDPRDQTSEDGSCGCLPRNLEDTTGSCAADYGWTVHRVRLVLLDLATGEDVMRDEPRLIFRCSAREATTPFILPTGTFGITLESYNPVNPELSTRALSPPPTMREIFPASKINLDVVAIGVNGP